MTELSVNSEVALEESTSQRIDFGIVAAGFPKKGLFMENVPKTEN